MKTFIFLALALAPLAAFGQSAPPPPAAAAAAPTTVIANGERHEIVNSGFTIVPPSGWEVLKDAGGATLLFQGPKPPPSTTEYVYQPNIAVRSFFEPRPFDDITRDEIAHEIVEACLLYTIAEPEHAESDEIAFTQRMAEAIEGAVRLYPEQWLWNYKRWRNPANVKS